MGQVGSVAALTDDEKRSLTETWAVVRKEAKKNAVGLFMAFFTKYPEQQKKFPAFADVPLDQLSTHPKLAAHALSVIFATSSIISSMDDNDVVEAMMVKQLTNHKARGVSVDNYQALQGVIAEYLSPNLSADDLKAWTHAFAIFNAHAEICNKS